MGWIPRFNVTAVSLLNFVDNISLWCKCVGNNRDIIEIHHLIYNSITGESGGPNIFCHHFLSSKVPHLLRFYISHLLRFHII